MGPYAIGISDRPDEEASPVLLTPGVPQYGSLQQIADEDVYRLSYSAGDIVRLNAFSIDVDQDLDLVVYSPIGSRLYAFTGSEVGLNETTLPIAGDYTVMVRSSSLRPTDYILDWKTRAADTPPPGPRRR